MLFFFGFTYVSVVRSEEVFGCWLLSGDSSGIVGCSVESFVVGHKIFVEFEYGGDVATSVAVVGRGPDGD